MIATLTAGEAVGASVPPVVVDASVLVEVLLASESRRRVMIWLVDCGASLHAPELLDVEVLHVLRRAVQCGTLTAARASESLAMLDEFPIRRHGHAPLRRRIWAHRANLSAYDATYVALAEGLGATLLTRDARLGSAPGVATEVQVV